jgi:hypothetical protein
MSQTRAGYTFTVQARTSDLSISKQQVFDKRISAEAYRLHHLLLALAQNPDWRYYTGGLATICKVHYDTIRYRIRQLKDAGYVSIEKVRSERGRFEGWRWTVYGCQREELARR